MQIDGNMAAANQLPVSKATGSGGSSQASEQPEVQQQSVLSEGSIISMLKQDGVLVNFSIDKETNEFVVKVINPFTNEVIRQVPPEEFPELASSIQQAGGMLVDQHA
jgi:flagellar protein FlaG